MNPVLPNGVVVAESDVGDAVMFTGVRTTSATGTDVTVPPADELMFSVPEYVPAAVGEVMVSEPHDPLAGQLSVVVDNVALPV